MNKTKDEMIATAKEGEHVINYLEPITPNDVRRAYFIGIETGVSVAYDHRQKEIDAAYERGLAAYVDRNLDQDAKIAKKAALDVNRWWASRWQTSHDWWYGPNGLEPSRNEYNLSDSQLKAAKEMDAAAAKVMEGSK